MTIEQIKQRMGTLVKSEISHLRKAGRKGNLRSIAQNHIGDIFWSLGLRWNRLKAPEDVPEDVML